MIRSAKIRWRFFCSQIRPINSLINAFGKKYAFVFADKPLAFIPTFLASV